MSQTWYTRLTVPRLCPHPESRSRIRVQNPCPESRSRIHIQDLTVKTVKENKSYCSLLIYIFSQKFANESVNCFKLLTRYPKKHWYTEKNAVLLDPNFLIRHTPGITKIPIWKYFMCILAKNFDISVLCTEKWHEFDSKRGIFSI